MWTFLYSHRINEPLSVLGHKIKSESQMMFSLARQHRNYSLVWLMKPGCYQHIPTRFLNENQQVFSCVGIFHNKPPYAALRKYPKKGKYVGQKGV